MTNVAPPNGWNAVPRGSNVTAQFSAPVDGSTVDSTNTFLLHSSQGGFRRGAMTFNAATNLAKFNPVGQFRPGEHIFAQLTDAILNAGHTASLVPYGWSFYTDVDGGGGAFLASTQSLGTNWSYHSAVGDVNNDGDLDVVYGLIGIGNVLWLNNGDGTFTDSGQTPGTNAYGLALGDLNNDGWLDLFIAPWAEPCQVWTNNRAGMLADSGQRLGPDRTSTDVVLGDVDGDGDLDAFQHIYSASSGGGPNKLWINDGNAVFSDSGQSLGSDGANWAVFGDVNADGWLDLLQARYNETATVWTNDRAGGLKDSGQSVGPLNINDLELGDVNGDGSLDAVMAYSGGCFIWTNRGDGVFSSVPTNEIAGNRFGLALGDVDDDGDLDIYLAGFQADAVLLNDGTGAFRSNGQGLGTNLNFDAALADLDGDGDVDAVTCGEDGLAAWFNVYPDLQVLGTNGEAVASGEAPSEVKGTDFGSLLAGWARTNTFTITNAGPVHLAITGVSTGGAGAALFRVAGVPAAVAPGTASNFTIRFGPTGPGAAEATISLANTGTNRPFEINVQGNGAAPRVTNTVPANGTAAVAPNADLVADFNDAMRGTTITSNRFLLYGEQSGFRYGAITFNAQTNRATLNPSADFRAGERVFAELTLGILNASGLGELTPYSWSFFAAVQGGSGVFDDSGQRPGTNAIGAAWGDVDGDGDLDAFLATGGADGDQVWTNDGAGVLYDSGQRLGTNNGVSVALGDVDRDGDLDALVLNDGQPAQVYTNLGGVFFDSGQELSSGQGRRGALVDVNGDGTLDAVINRMGTDNTRVWTNDGAGVFTDTGQAIVNGRWMDVGDVNGDGTLDLCTAAYGGSGRVWTNNGTGWFGDTGLRLGATTNKTWAVALGDLNGDHALDMFWALDRQGCMVWTNDGAGQFYDTGQALGTNDARHVALGDVDADGDLDAWTANYGGPDTLWLNDGTGLFTDSGQELGIGNGVAAAFGDANGDGIPDVLASRESGASLLWLNGGPAIEVLGTNGALIANGEGASAAKGTVFADLLMNRAETNLLSLSNPSAFDLVIYGATTGGTGAASFLLEAVPERVAAGTASNFPVVFRPAGIGTVTAMVTLASSSTNTPYAFGLKGTGTGLRLTNTIPARGAADADPDVILAAQFDTAMLATTIYSNTFLVHGAFSGFHEGAVALGGGGMEATLGPAAGFLPGEPVTAWLPWGVTNAGGDIGLYPHHWPFFASTAPGSGVFADSGQQPGSNTSCHVLGDFNGDGAMDLFIGARSNRAGHAVWTNDGAGVLYDTGLRLGTNQCVQATAGDVNRDGRLDVLVINNAYRVEVWTNGGAAFGLAQNFATTYGWAVAAGDVNSDGALDLLVGMINFDPDVVYTNDGRGTFGYAWPATANTYSDRILLGDLDGDGDLDLVSARSAGSTYTCLNDGTGRFAQRTNLGSVQPHGTALGDVDGDGDLDVLVTEDKYFEYQSRCRIFLNDGTGGFSSGGNFGLSAYPRDVALGDVDGDGDLDAVTSHASNYATRVYWNIGAGSFSYSGQQMDGGVGRNANLGDFDGDGRLDVLISANGQPNSLWIQTYPEIQLLGTNGAALVNGAPAAVEPGTDFGDVGLRQQAAHTFSVTNPSGALLSILSANLSGSDFFALSGMPARVDPYAVSNFTVTFQPKAVGLRTAIVEIVNNATNSPYLLNLQATGAFLLTNTVPAPAAPDVAAGADVIAQFGEAVSQPSVSSGNFFLYSGQSKPRYGAISFNGASTEATLDLFLDFKPGELLFAELRSVTNAAGTVTLDHYTWTFHAAAPAGLGTFVDSGQALATNNGWGVALGDLDGDDDLDAVIANYQQAGLVWTNQGGVFADSGQLLGTNNPSRSVALGDVDRDGDLDAVFGNDGAANEVWTNDGHAVFGDSGQRLGSAATFGVALADLNGDGWLDLYELVNGAADRVWTNDGAGAFFNSGQSLGSAAGYGVALGDLDGEGTVDAFVANRNEANRVWLNDGTGVLVNNGQSLATARSRGVALGDLDGDGDLDAYVANDGAADEVWINDGLGIFTLGQSPGSDNGRSVALGDVDADGDLDAVVLNNGANKVWINDGAGAFTDSGQSLGSALSMAAALGDVNGDGAVDAFVANQNVADELWLNAAHRITPSAGLHGAIEPSTPVLLPGGGGTSFVVTADAYYFIGQLLTNGAADPAAAGLDVYTSTWDNVTADGAVYAEFSEHTAFYGTPWWWLAQWGLTNGGLTFDEAETNDADGDTFNARDERIADTSPADSNDYFHVTRLWRTNSMAVTFGSSTARVYALESCGMLEIESWIAVEGQTNVPGDASGTTTLTDTNHAARGMYRVGVGLP
ncbi:MAG: VCBS repeat-containing protein [Kiritimatiellae bacterium]|nr:VCBS repeat-containing protein [Kiritimatiellia bacterium]